MVVWNLELSDRKLRILMNGNGTTIFWNRLANYILACKSKRQEFLDRVVFSVDAP